MLSVMRLPLLFFLLSYVQLIKADFPLLDLQEYISDIIIEEKQIIIPNHPRAFNPSLVRWHNGELLLAFRDFNSDTHIANLMGFVWLDENFNVISEPTLLQIENDLPLVKSRAQGIRLVMVKDVCYVVYNNSLSDTDFESKRVIASKLSFHHGIFSIKNPELIVNYEGDPSHWREKNWSPFSYKNKLCFSYTINPHRVLRLENANTCSTISRTSSNINWPWGEIHGGTPALLDGNYYLGFFHSWQDLQTVQSNNEKISHFFIGAYLFKSTPPFKVTHISPMPIIGSSFYSGNEYKTWKPLKVVYPCGHIFDEKFIWLVYGKQDNECWVAKIDKHKLYNSLIKA